MKKRITAALMAFTVCLSGTAFQAYAKETDIAAAGVNVTALEYDVLESMTVEKTFLRIGEYTNIQLKWAGNCDRKPSVIYKSDDPKVASTSSDGKIFAEGYGDTTITVTAGNVSISTDITVRPPVSGTIGDNITWTYDEDDLLTVSGEGEMVIEGRYATWHDWHKYIKNIVVEEGITNIPDGAFNLLTNVDTITLPSTVADIDLTSGFTLRCRELIVSPDNPNYTSEDGVLFNKDKTVLLKYPSLSENSSYIIPDTVGEIAEFAFTACKNIQSVVIPDSVYRIDANFPACKSLSDVTMSNNLVKIDGMSFLGTPWLTAQQEIDPLVISGGFVLNGVTCEGEVTIPGDIKGIADYAFVNNENVTGIIFSEGITDTGYAAFNSCPNLKKVEFSDTVETIGFASFLSTGIEDVVVPENVKVINAGAFSDCNDLKTITILNKDCAIFDAADTICNINETRIPSNITTVEFTGTIRGYEGSTAQEYAEKYGYNFEAVKPAETVAGDFNGDGEFGIADMVTLQNWLLGAEAPEGDSWEAADLCKDGVLNSFDLCVMRKMLVAAMDKSSANEAEK